MVAKLSPELVRELEQAGDKPLTVENPSNKRVYVLVDIEQYDVVRRFPHSLVGWTDEKNKRRCDLIRKKFSEGLDAADACELNELQQEVSAYRKQSALLPYDVVDALQAALISSPDSPAESRS
jgi:hypothetical protein